MSEDCKFGFEPQAGGFSEQQLEVLEEYLSQRQDIAGAADDSVPCTLNTHELRALIEMARECLRLRATPVGMRSLPFSVRDLLETRGIEVPPNESPRAKLQEILDDNGRMKAALARRSERIQPTKLKEAFAYLRANWPEGDRKLSESLLAVCDQVSWLSEEVTRFDGRVKS